MKLLSLIWSWFEIVLSCIPFFSCFLGFLYWLCFPLLGSLNRFPCKEFLQCLSLWSLLCRRFLIVRRKWKRILFLLFYRWFWFLSKFGICRFRWNYLSYSFYMGLCKIRCFSSESRWFRIIIFILEILFLSKRSLTIHNV